MSGTNSGIYSPEVCGIASPGFSILNRLYSPKNKFKTINSYSVLIYVANDFSYSYSDLRLQDLKFISIAEDDKSSNSRLKEQILNSIMEYFITIEVFINTTIIRLQEYYQRFYAE